MQKKPPFWLFPNLFSLDAPLVALAWLWFFNDVWVVLNLPGEMWVISYILCGAVWVIYVVDRLVDHRAQEGGAGLGLRHHYHWRYRAVLKNLVWFVVLSCGWLSLTVMPRSIVSYALLVGVIVGGYFFLAKKEARDHELSLMKNLLGAMAFGLGVASASHAMAPHLTMAGMLTEVEVWLFVGLCFLNITAIDFWELGEEDEEEASGMLGGMIMITCGVVVFLAIRATIYQKPFFYAVLSGAAGLYFLNRFRHFLSSDQRRVLVDGALLLPPFVYWVWMRFY